MKKKPSKVLIVIGVIALVALVTAFNNWRTRLASQEINAEFLSENWGFEYDIAEVLYAEKFTDNESAAIALYEDSNGTPGVFVVWDGWSRYDRGVSVLFDDATRINKQQTEETKFGDVYYCLFTDPQADTVEVNDETHRVYRFSGVVDGEKKELGFYCGFNEK